MGFGDGYMMLWRCMRSRESYRGNLLLWYGSRHSSFPRLLQPARLPPSSVCDGDAVEVGWVKHRLPFSKRVEAKHDTSKGTTNRRHYCQILGLTGQRIFQFALTDHQFVLGTRAPQHELDRPFNIEDLLNFSRRLLTAQDRV